MTVVITYQNFSQASFHFNFITKYSVRHLFRNPFSCGTPTRWQSHTKHKQFCIL